MKKPLKIENCQTNCKCRVCGAVPRVKGVRQCWVCESKTCPEFKKRPCKMFNNIDVWRSIELFNTYGVTEIKKKFPEEYKKEAIERETRLKTSQQKLFKEVTP